MRGSDELGQEDVPTRRAPTAVTAEVAPRGSLSLEGAHGSIAVPHHDAGFWEQWRAFVTGIPVGPAGPTG